MRWYILHEEGLIVAVRPGVGRIPQGYMDIESETRPDPDVHYILDGGLVEYTESERQAKASPPTNRSKWSVASMSWVDLRTLRNIKDAKWRDIKTVRERRESSGFVWNGHAFDSDPMSQSRIQGAVIMAMQALSASQPFQIDWTLADNSVIELSAIDLIGVGQALAVHVATQHSIARALRAAIETAETVQEVEAVTWPVEVTSD